MSVSGESRSRRVEVDPTIKVAGHGIICGSPDYATRKRSPTKETVIARAGRRKEYCRAEWRATKRFRSVAGR